jgi:hypothetical protein
MPALFCTHAPRQRLAFAQRRTFLEWTPVNNRDFLTNWTKNDQLIDWVLDRMKLLEVCACRWIDSYFILFSVAP